MRGAVRARAIPTIMNSTSRIGMRRWLYTQAARRTVRGLVSRAQNTSAAATIPAFTAWKPGWRYTAGSWRMERRKSIVAVLPKRAMGTPAARKSWVAA